LQTPPIFSILSFSSKNSSTCKTQIPDLFLNYFSLKIVKRKKSPESHWFSPNPYLFKRYKMTLTTRN
jgi:hypothetical protein